MSNQEARHKQPYWESLPHVKAIIQKLAAAIAIGTLFSSPGLFASLYAQGHANNGADCGTGRGGGGGSGWGSGCYSGHSRYSGANRAVRNVITLPTHLLNISEIATVVGLVPDITPKVTSYC